MLSYSQLSGTLLSPTVSWKSQGQHMSCQALPQSLSSWPRMNECSHSISFQHHSPHLPLAYSMHIHRYSSISIRVKPLLKWPHLRHLPEPRESTLAVQPTFGRKNLEAFWTGNFKISSSQNVV